MKESKLYWNLSSTSYMYINILSFFGMHLCAIYHMCCKLIGPIDIIFKLKLESAMPSTRIKQQDFKGAALPHTVFTRISTAVLIKFFAPQMRCLFEGGTYLKIGLDKEIFSINLTVY